MPTLTLELFPKKYLVCRFSPETQAANIWLPMEGFWSLTRTPDEVSLVMEEGNVLPARAVVEEDWRMFRVAGKLEFELVGILAELSSVLAVADVSIFVISTYDTDYLLVKADQLIEALTILKKAHYQIVEWQPESVILDSPAT